MATLHDALRLITAGDYAAAEHAAEAAQDQAPDDPGALLLRAMAAALLGDADRAAPLMRDAMVLSPGSVHPCVKLARLRPAVPRAVVERQFRACLRWTPRDGQLRQDFADFLLDGGLEAEALTVLAPLKDSAAAWHLRGLALGGCGRFGEAIGAFRRAVALNPEAAASWSNLGMMLKVEGQFADAITAHDHAIALEPRNPRFQVNRAVCRLKSGDWDRAWPDHTARFALPGAPPIDPDRLLLPGSAVPGRIVAVLHEDGYGDTMQWLRYLPLLAERGARVIAVVPGALARLVAMVPGVSRVTTNGSEVPGEALLCPMASLPAFFGSTVDTVPPPPLLTAPDEPSGPVRVGLVWKGQARPNAAGFDTMDRSRSAGFDAFRPLLDVPDVTFVGLQFGEVAPDGRVRDAMGDVRDFADTLAIVAGLDAVISVDTAMVHLAGLAGKRVFLLDRHDGCWRWLHGRTDSPWYPRLTIFRQTVPGDWSGPMEDVAAALRRLASHGRVGPETSASSGAETRP